MVQSIDASATGEYGVGDGTLALRGARLVAAAAAATAIIRETDGSGRILAKLSAAITGSDEFNPPAGVAYQTKMHVTVAGAGAQLNLFV